MFARACLKDDVLNLSPSSLSEFKSQILGRKSSFIWIEETRQSIGAKRQSTAPDEIVITWIWNASAHPFGGEVRSIICANYTAGVQMRK